jgi:hypothetical protein
MTSEPAQTEVAEALILTEGSTVETTDMVMAFEVAFDGLAQVNEDVISTVITSPFANPENW